MNLQTKQKGFTIVELLIVIVVIAILAAISIVAFTGIQQRGRDSERSSDVSNIAKALNAYTSDGNAWPVDNAAAKTALNAYTTVNVPATAVNKLGATASSTSTTSVYGYAVCPAGATGTAGTGASLTYRKESPATGETNPVTVKVGAGC